MGTVPFFPSRRGISLMEVLISVFILSIGLLGVAAMIPLGALSLRDTAKSDYTGACGRAGIHDVRVRSLLGNVWHASSAFSVNALVTPITTNGHTYQCTVAGITGATEPAWVINGGTVTDGGVTWQDIGKVFVADPLGTTASLAGTFGTSSVQRVNLFCTTTAAAAAALCRWHDDLTFARPEEIKSATPPPAGSRPQAVLDASNNVQYSGSFSWLLTAAPSSLQPGVYNVAVVVCSQRNLANEQTCTVTDPSTGNPATIANGGGALLLTAATGTVNVRENTWIMLCNAGGTQAQWYRVANAGPGGSTQTLCLVGPDWTGAASDLAVIIDTVTGVYTTTVQLN